MGYILKLAGWYPSRVDLYNGDFVQRHARAISLYRKVIVLFLTKDPSLQKGKVEIHKSERGNLTEYIVYYSQAKIFDKALSLWRYISLGKEVSAMIRKEHGRPDLVHVNIVWKAGLIALYLKKYLNLKYVITENWTGYYEQDPFGLRSKSWFERKIYQKIFEGTSLFIPVSADLGRQVSLLFQDIRSEIVYNAVDTDFFNYQSPTAPLLIKKLIHVSTFGFQKNIEGLLKAVGRLARVREDFELTMVGPYPETLKRGLEESGLLNKRIFLTGEISYVEVALHVKQSHIMVLFSRFENLPCVLLEGFCCGLPAVATNVGGIPEIINGENGAIVEAGNEDGLFKTLHTMLDNFSGYDRKKIAKEAAAKFSYQAIGRKFADIYSRIQ